MVVPRCAKRGLVLNSAVGGGRLVLNSDLSRSSRGAACRGDWADMDTRTSAGCTLPGDIIITTDAGFVATDASRPRCESPCSDERVRLELPGTEHGAKSCEEPGYQHVLGVVCLDSS